MPGRASSLTVRASVAPRVSRAEQTSPTVTSLAQSDHAAVETVVPKRGVNTLLPRLSAAGARDILEIPISKIVE